MSGPSAFLEQLRHDGFVRDTGARLTPLSGGVSSEIYLVEDGDDRFVVKRALAKLKVKDDWFADVSRNASERNYLECVGHFLPDAVPQLRFASPESGYFGMEYFSEDFANWKKLLLDGTFETAHARMAGRIAGEIHRRTAGVEEVRRQFNTNGNFHQLRTAPYLLTTGERHPDLRDFFFSEAKRLEGTEECLVHGDFSPKNILICGSRMVLLDCEVAWYGNSAFDVAFLLNHLFLKGLFHAPRVPGLRKMVDEFWCSYLGARQYQGNDLEGRVMRLLPLLLLARVDGKSPVEYLDPSRAQCVRRFVREHLLAGPAKFDTFTNSWFSQLQTIQPLPHCHEN